MKIQNAFLSSPVPNSPWFFIGFCRSFVCRFCLSDTTLEDGRICLLRHLLLEMATASWEQKVSLVQGRCIFQKAVWCSLSKRSHAEIDLHKGTDLKTYFKVIGIQHRYLHHWSYPVPTLCEKVGVFAGWQLLLEQMFTYGKWELISNFAVSLTTSLSGMQVAL